MKSIINEYISKMNDIKLTPQIRANLSERIAEERAYMQQQSDSISYQSTTTANHRRHYSSAHRHTIAIAACVASLVLGCTALSLWAPSSVVQPAQQYDQDTSSASLTNAQPTFVLAAYADGTPIEDRSNTVLVNSGFMDFVGSWVAGPNDEDGSLSAYNVFNIDLRAHGNDITQLDYHIDGDGTAQFYYLGSRNYHTTDETYEELCGQSVTITQDMLSRIGTIDGGTFSIRLDYTLPEEFWTLYEQSQKGMLDEFRLESITYGAKLLAGRTITITATFTDDTTLTHQYRINPVDNFKEVLMTNDKTFVDNIDSSDTSDIVFEPLFTIEQIS